MMLLTMVDLFSYKVDDEHTQTRTISSESPVKKSLSWTQRLHHRLLGDNRLNLFMCLYLGFFHAMAIHAIVVLYFFDGKDELLNVGDILIKKTLNALFGTQLATEPASLPVQSRTLLFAALLWPISALGITAGAHRLWAHKSYQAHFIPRLVLMLFNSIANQGTEDFGTVSFTKATARPPLVDKFVGVEVVDVVVVDVVVGTAKGPYKQNYQNPQQSSRHASIIALFL